jgi:hypothetical protein
VAVASDRTHEAVTALTGAGVDVAIVGEVVAGDRVVTLV